MCRYLNKFILKFAMLLWILVLFVSLPNIQGVPEPCRLNNPDDTTIATMCSNSVAVENEIDGNIFDDRILLRVVNRTENCVCDISLVNQTKDVFILIRKENNINTSFPTNNHCGLKVDIDYHTSSQTEIDTIQCTQPVRQQRVLIPTNNKLRLQSKLIKGDFENGYCVEIIRPTKKGQTINPQLSINCSIHETATSTTSVHSITSQSPDKDETTNAFTTREQVTSETSTQDKPTSASTTVIAKDVGTWHDVATDTDTVRYHDVDQTENEEKKTTFYVTIVAGSIAFLVIILVMAITISKRITSASFSRAADKAKNSKSSYRNVQSDPDDGLQDNCLYIPSESYVDDHANNDGDNKSMPKDIKIDTDGNYSTITLDDTSKVCNNKNDGSTIKTEKTDVKLDNSSHSQIDMNTNDKIKHTEQPEVTPNAGNVYAVVNKTSKNFTLTEKSTDKSLTGGSNNANVLNVDGDYCSIEFDEVRNGSKTVSQNENNNTDCAREKLNIKGDEQSAHQGDINVEVVNSNETTDSKEYNQSNIESDHIYSVVNKSLKQGQDTSGLNDKS